jgi:hypothetical protein
MKAAGVHDPLPIIQSSFSKRGREFFDLVVRKANEWMGMDDAARDQLAQQIAEMSEFTPSETDMSTAPRAASTQHAHKNVPLRTYAASDTDLREKYKAAIRGRIRTGKF